MKSKIKNLEILTQRPEARREADLFHSGSFLLTENVPFLARPPLGVDDTILYVRFLTRQRTRSICLANFSFPFVLLKL